ncbi:MAG: hypothetical protein U0800_02730 [Isosphaeraceae bacterium]
MRARQEDVPATARKVQPPPRSAWSNPRNVVPLAFVGLLLAAGGRKLYEHWRARLAVLRLEDSGVTPEEILVAASFGRAGLTEFFRLLAEGKTPEVRKAAGRALGLLWKRDDLVAEEEKQVATRGFEVHWTARRRYPRAMGRSIPITVRYGLLFLTPSGDGLGPDDLEWSARITETQRASLEAFTPWAKGEGRLDFAIEPDDFDGTGPHRLVLQARVRPRHEAGEAVPPGGLAKLTKPSPAKLENQPAWEQDLPHIPFTFELDPLLQPSALLASADSVREEAIRRAVRLEDAPEGTDPPAWLPINEDLVIRNPPALTIHAPIPCDLAHSARAEVEGVAGSIPLRAIVVDGQPGEARAWRFPLEPSHQPADRPTLDRPGNYRFRVVLTPDAELGWASPEVRSVWPQPIVTDWIDVRVIRR